MLCDFGGTARRGLSRGESARIVVVSAFIRNAPGVLSARVARLCNRIFGIFYDDE